MKRIAVIMHRDAKGRNGDYLISRMAKLWRALGMDVVLVFGTQAGVEADLAVLHVDATVVPRSYLNYMKRFPRVLNSAVEDISKRRISRQPVLRDDAYAGPVMVKTNLNSLGGPERRRRPLVRLWRFLQTRRGKRDYWKGPPLPAYQVFDRKADLPAGMWKDRRLFLERFLPERDGEFYCLRTWVFFGDCEAASLGYSLKPVVKGANIVKREKLETIPDDLRAIRRQLGFDFGKFDFAVVDGKTVLYDVNRTPAMGGVPPEVILPMIEALAKGIHFYEPLD